MVARMRLLSQVWEFLAPQGEEKAKGGTLPLCQERSPGNQKSRWPPQPCLWPPGLAGASYPTSLILSESFVKGGIYYFYTELS